MTLIKAKIVSFSHLNQLFSTQGKVILASALRAMAIFNASGISLHSFGMTKPRSCCFVIIKSSLMQKI